LFYCTDWSSVHSVEGGVTGVQLDGGQDGLTAGSGGGNGGDRGGHSGGSGVVEGETGNGSDRGGGVVEGETGGIGIGEASDGGGGDHGRSGLVSRPLAVESMAIRMSISDNGGGGDLVGDLGGGDDIRLDGNRLGNSADRGEGRESSGEGGSSIGKTSIWETSQDLGVSISRPLAIESRVSISDNGGGGDLVGDLGGGDDIRLDNGGVSNSADRGEGRDSGGEGGSVGQTSITTIGEDLGIGLSLLPLSSGGGGGSVESSLELGLGGGDLSSVLDVLCLALDALKHGGDKRSDLRGSGGGGAHGEVGGGHSEAVHGVGNIVDSLEEAVGVNVLVTTGGHTIGVPGLSLGGGAPGVTEGELAELVLGVELCGGGGGGDGELGPGDTDTGG